MRWQRGVVEFVEPQLYLAMYDVIIRRALFLVINIPESTVLIKSATSASFQANSITEPSSESLPYNFPYLICPECTNLRSASDRLICSGGSFFGRGPCFVRLVSYSSTTSRLVLVVRTVPAAPIPSSRSWWSSLMPVKRLSNHIICLFLLKYRLPLSSCSIRSNTTAYVLEKPFSFVQYLSKSTGPFLSPFAC